MPVYHYLFLLFAVAENVEKHKYLINIFVKHASSYRYYVLIILSCLHQEQNHYQVNNLQSSVKHRAQGCILPEAWSRNLGTFVSRTSVDIDDVA